MIDVPTKFPFPPKSSSGGTYTLDVQGYVIEAYPNGYKITAFGTPLKITPADSHSNANCDARTNAQRALEALRDHLHLTSQE